MLSPKLNEALNHQLNAEFCSSYTYLAMAAHFAAENLEGFEHFFRVQAREELGHAMKIFDYICKAGGKARLAAVETPKGEFSSPLKTFEHALANEQKLTGEIYKLMDLAMAERHHATRILLNWFVTEQQEEENLFCGCVSKLQLAGSDGQGILLLNQEFKARMGEQAE